jgi:hypothetical protein
MTCLFARLGLLPLAELRDRAYAGHCRARHRRKAPPVMDDGTELDIKGGDAYEIAPGHNAWVEGNEPFSGVEFESLAEYAKG